jgi:hypothetical protein
MIGGKAMAYLEFHYLDGKVEKHNKVRISKKNKMYHMWKEGPHEAGTKPIKSVRYSALHAMSRTGKKGLVLGPNRGYKYY